MRLGKNTSGCLTFSSTKLYAQRCLGGCCKVHCARLPTGGNTKPCTNVVKGLGRETVVLCSHSCGYDSEKVIARCRKPRALESEFRLLAAKDPL